MTNKVLFTSDFWTGPDPKQLDSAKWDFNRWEKDNNPSYLGLTQMRQYLPYAWGGAVRIRLDTWNDGDREVLSRVGSDHETGVCSPRWRRRHRLRSRA